MCTFHFNNSIFCPHKIVLWPSIKKNYEIKRSILKPNTVLVLNVCVHLIQRNFFIAYVIAAMKCLPQDFIVVKRAPSGNLQIKAIHCMHVDKRRVGSGIIKNSNGQNHCFFMLIILLFRQIASNPMVVLQLNHCKKSNKDKTFQMC